jgi:hypothetical protein
MSKIYKILNHSQSDIIIKDGVVKHGPGIINEVDSVVAEKLLKMYPFLQKIAEEEIGKNNKKVEDQKSEDVGASNTEAPASENDRAAKKAERKLLLEKAAELGLNVASNVSLADLKAFVAAAEEAKAKQGAEE